jgi:hypothetical protein
VAFCLRTVRLSREFCREREQVGAYQQRYGVPDEPLK